MVRPVPEGKGTMANVLSRAKRIAALHALVNGNSERSVSDLAGVNARTVARLAVEFGTGAARLHDVLARDLTCTDVECDEIWGYVAKKQARVKPGDAPEIGEAYTYVALDRASRFVIAFHVGKRDQKSTDVFMADLRARLVMMPNISTDGFVPYVSAVGAEFGHGAQFAQMSKNYSAKGRRDDHRYEPPRGIKFITKKTVYGSPDLDETSTAHVERQNCTMRHQIGRIRRLCLAFSKRFDRHCYAVNLGYVWYNVGWVVKGLRMTPAMAVGATDRLWSIEEFHDAITELATAPTSKPERKPLAHQVPAETARELPNNRGFLRVVQTSAGGPSPSPAPPMPPVPASAAVAPAAGAVVDESGQLDLLSWRAPKREPEQLSLFPAPLDGI